MRIVREKLRDGLLGTGFAFLLATLVLFGAPSVMDVGEGSYFGLFVLHFGFAVVYFFVLWLSGGRKVEDHRMTYTFLKLLLFLVSAYALNRCMNVFESSAGWMCVLLWIVGANYVAALFFREMHRWGRYIVMFTCGIAFLFFLYLACYLLPLYLIGLVGMLLFGIAVHAFIPIFMAVSTLSLVRWLAGNSRRLWVSFCCGLLVTILFVTCYCLVWNANVKTLNEAYAHAASEGADDIPAWMQVAQRMNQNGVTERIIKTSLVYDVPEWSGNAFWSMPGQTLGEVQKVHDPLVVVASLFSEPIMLSVEERLSVLKSQFGARHHTEERLWSGRDLTTEHVVTNVRIWPGSHIAYTEAILTVFNHAQPQWGTGQEEAIYTFDLPEGSAVTSLSLWINGREKKALLTTRAKADTAYQAIVGVERHDPSVVHWQEGSRISVRVFPVVARQSRVFKIGVTSPLRKEGDRLVYDNLRFEGPDAGGATGSVHVKTDGSDTNAEGRQVAFRSSGSNAYEHSGAYKPRWSFDLPDPGLQSASFTFNGSRYFIGPYEPTPVSALLENIYLDINESWTREEFESIWKAAAGKAVWVYDDEMVRLNAANKDEWFRILSEKKFTLFPLFLVPNPSTALVVSRSGAQTPNLADLRGSPFYSRLRNFSPQRGHLRLFHFGGMPSAYLASLRDYRFFQFAQGTVADAAEAIGTGRFPASAETDNKVVIYSAGLVIGKEPGSRTSTGPDHLMRLFAYNHLLQKYGSQGLDSAETNEAMQKEAAEANIVSPVSSLVVLETQQDYDRFDIEKSRNSLGNATLKSSGAVPEPHEWVLIILFAIGGGYLLYKRKYPRHA
ncbi:MAG: XrtN system protein [Flaviaesturariibacter sp.]|nr:XrtN system protein [Flaviaesturariibacter sp.]